MRARDACPADQPALERIKKPSALHADRLRDAEGGDFRYLVLEDGAGELAGHACLVFRRPASWPPDDPGTPYPRVIDLMIARARRRQGCGKALMRAMEKICRGMGLGRLNLSVDPQDSGALAFYRALGYQPEPGEPRHRAWFFKDSAGNVHRGAGLDMRMSRDLASA